MGFQCVCLAVALWILNLGVIGFFGAVASGNHYQGPTSWFGYPSSFASWAMHTYCSLYSLIFGIVIILLLVVSLLWKPESWTVKRVKFCLYVLPICIICMFLLHLVLWLWCVVAHDAGTCVFLALNRFLVGLQLSFRFARRLSWLGDAHVLLVVFVKNNLRCWRNRHFVATRSVEMKGMKSMQYYLRVSFLILPVVFGGVFLFSFFFGFSRVHSRENLVLKRMFCSSSIRSAKTLFWDLLAEDILRFGIVNLLRSSTCVLFCERRTQLLITGVARV